MHPTIRKALPSDSKRIWEMRNHPCVRNVSGDTREIPYETHQKWFEAKYFSKKNNYCFIIDGHGIVLGYCRYDLNQHENLYRVSIAIDDAYHGKGYGRILLGTTITLLPHGSEVIAEINVLNTRSLNLFKSIGFTVRRHDDAFYHLYHRVSAAESVS